MLNIIINGAAFVLPESALYPAKRKGFPNKINADPGALERKTFLVEKSFETAKQKIDTRVN